MNDTTEPSAPTRSWWRIVVGLAVSPLLVIIPVTIWGIFDADSDLGQPSLQVFWESLGRIAPVFYALAAGGAVVSKLVGLMGPQFRTGPVITATVAATAFLAVIAFMSLGRSPEWIPTISLGVLGAFMFAVIGGVYCLIAGVPWRTKPAS